MFQAVDSYLIQRIVVFKFAALATGFSYLLVGSGQSHFKF